MDAKWNLEVAPLLRKLCAKVEHYLLAPDSESRSGPVPSSLKLPGASGLDFETRETTTLSAHDRFRTHPASSAQATSAGHRMHTHSANWQVKSPRCSAAIRLSTAHQISGPSTSTTSRIDASATARIRLRPALCSCITPREAITTRRVRPATRQSRPACVPASADSRSLSALILVRISPGAPEPRPSTPPGIWPEPPGLWPDPPMVT